MTANEFQVGRTRAGIVMAAYPEVAPMSEEEALNLAAWLVMVVQGSKSKVQGSKCFGTEAQRRDG